MPPTQILSYLMLAVEAAWAVPTSVYIVYVYAQLFGGVWLTALLVSLCLLSFCAAPWGTIMNIGWRETWRRLWRGFLSAGTPWRVWGAVWLLHASVILIACIAYIPRWGVMAPWRFNQRPATVAPNDWVADRLLPHVALRGTLELARTTAAYVAFDYVTARYNQPRVLLILSAVAVGLFIIKTPTVLLVVL